MNIINSDGVLYLEFKALKAYGFIKQATSTRIGGVTKAPGLSSLNLGTYTSDDPANVRENYRIFCRAAGFDVTRLVLGNQSHSLNVRYATPEDCGKGIFSRRDYSDVDALITDYADLPLVIHTADCVPVLFVDVKKRAIGAAHCGWRGTFGNLAKITADAMAKNFGTKPCDLVCTIGPCICQSCYEVSEDLFTVFTDKFGQSPAIKFQNNAFYIDLAAVNKQILIGLGVKPQSIHISDLCTSCSREYLYSHRGLGPQRGIFSSVLQLV